MSRRFTAFVVAAMTAAVAAAPGLRAADLPTLYVDYRDDCTFRVTNDAGATVTSVAPGTYQVAISTGEPFGSYPLSTLTDLAACRGNVSFRMTGPGVDVFTTLDGGDGAFEIHGVVLQAGGTYTLQDDRNVAGTRRTIAAASSTPAATPASRPSTATAPKPEAKPNLDAVGKVKGKLVASVTTAGKLSLTYKGRPVSELRSGRYTITVLDETSKTGFKIQRRGKPATTVSTNAFLGRRTVTVALARGQWMFYSSPSAKHLFVVIA
jgi:hypothetical protein